MAIDKSRTSPFVKTTIIVLAVLLVLTIGGTAFVPLLESILNPTGGNSTGTGGTGSATATDTVAALSQKYAGRIQANDAKLKTDAKNYDVLVDQAQAYHDWANDVMQATKQQGATDRPLWLLAVDFYGKALAVKPGDPNVSTDMAIAQFYTGDIQGAITTAVAVKTANPKFAQVYFNLGVFYDAAGQTADAIAAYEGYIKVDPQGQLVADAKSRIASLKTKPSTPTSPTP